MFAEVIPIIKLPRKFSYFDYAVPPELENKIKIGHIVAVSFHGQDIYGAVKTIKKEAAAEAKKIQPIKNLTEIILPANYLSLLEEVANDCVASPAILLKSALPKITTKPQKELNFSKKEKLSLQKNDADYVAAILEKYKKCNGNKFFVYEKSLAGTLALFIKLAEKATQGGRQAIFLAPSLADMETCANILAQYFDKQLIIWQGTAAKMQFTDWQKILSGDPVVVLGTRPAALLPVKNDSLIFVYNSASDDHKQWDMNPRYDARIVAEKMATRGAKIFFSDILPGSEIYQKIADNDFAALGEMPVSHSGVFGSIKKEQIISFPAEEAAREALAAGKSSIFFLNRAEGDSRYTCIDCGHLFTCSKCAKPVSVDNNSFLCYNCQVKTEVPASCPKCRGMRLKAKRCGIKSVQKNLAKEFPQAKISITSRGGEFPSPDFDILITTDYFWKNILPRLNVKNIQTAVLADFDSYLAKPEYNTKESALYALWRIYNFSAGNGLRLVIQTAAENQDIFQKPEAVCKADLEDRKILGYPPFGKIVKIICKETRSELAESNAAKLYDDLISANFHPLPPYAPFKDRRAKHFLRHIILKEEAKKNLDGLKKIVPDEYQIDITPLNIY
jgi:primosomal protein N' (replication factor Y)